MIEYFNDAFRLNGLKVSYGDLSEVAYSLIKEGEAYEREIGDFLLDWVSDSDEILQRTSGSTGTPKMISISKSAMVQSALATGTYLGLEPGSRALLCLSAGNIAGRMMIVRSLVLGWKLYLAPPSSRPLEHLDRSVDIVSMVPFQLSHSLEDLSRASNILVGGAPLLPGLLAAIPSGGVAIYESYGMTETASHVALRKLEPVPESRDREEVLPPFEALPGISFEQDDRGCLVIRASRLSPKPIVTNDLVVLEGPDRFRWLGREDHAVNSGGVKLIPEQLEARIAKLLDRPFFLAGMPHKELGEQLVLVVEGAADKDVLETIRKSDLLGPYEIPRQVYFLPGFTQTETGKINRPETLKMLS